MAITIVGTSQVASENNGADVTITFDGTPLKDDLVLLFGGNAQDDANEPFGPVTAGYTTITTHRDAANDGSIGAWYKFMGATPDTTVVGDGGGDAQDAVVYLSVVLRGVDTTTPMDATATKGNAGILTNPAITTVTDGAWVVIGAKIGGDDDPTAPSGYSNLVSASPIDTNRYSAALATKEVTTAATETPGAWGSWTDDAFYGITVAVRPASSGTLHERTATIALSVSTGGTTMQRTAKGTSTIASLVTLGDTIMQRTAKGVGATTSTVAVSAAGSRPPYERTASSALAVTLGDTTMQRTAKGQSAFAGSIALGGTTMQRTAKGQGSSNISISVSGTGISLAQRDTGFPFWAGTIPGKYKQNVKKFWRDRKSREDTKREV